MDTIFTDGQLAKTIETLRQKGMTPERYNTHVLGSGYLAAISDSQADPTKLEDLRKLLGLGPLTFPKPDFKIWRTVKYSGRDTTAFRASFKAKGIQIGTYADQILNNVMFPAVGTEADIVRTSGAQMHFDKAARRDAIYERAFGFGLIKIEPWVALEARDEYLTQPKGEWILAGMEPIVDAGRGPELFGLERGDGGELWLYSDYGCAGFGWGPDGGWLFGLPRK